MSDPVAATSAVAEPLVTPEWLAARIGQVARNDDGLLILDIRSVVDGGGRQAYEAGHIPGAVYTDYAKDGWRVTKGMAAGLLPDRDALARLLGSVGLAPHDHAVIVSAGTSVGDFSAAARVYWTLKTAGHAMTSILSGGMVGWQRDPARPLETGAAHAHASAPPYPVKSVNALRAELAAVEAAVADRGAVLLDSRAANYFEGCAKSPQVARPGRLPGALLLDHAAAFDANAMALKPTAELARLFASVPAKPVINYCNTGHQAATNWFVLSEVLRRPDVSLYDGSLSQWAEDPSRPVESGEADTSSK